MKTTLLIALLPLLLAASCKKDKLADELSKLPPATQTGANTFGCLVNGKAWVPQGGCFLCPSVLKFYYSTDNGGTFDVQAVRESGLSIEKLLFGFYPCSTTSKKEFSSLNSSVVISYLRSTNICPDIYSRDSQVVINGNVEITAFDLTKGIISGRFEFTLSKQSCEKINITNGRFDAKL
jgi:hypothetical protein